MEFVFEEKKTAQAAAHLLRRHGGDMPYFNLIKLLYLADRHALIEEGYPITGDRPVSMPHGPVLSRVYDLIKNADGAVWPEFVTEPEGWTVRATGCTEIGKLSEYDTDVLDEVYDEFGRLDWWKLREITHQLPEWRDPQGSSSPIDPADILRAAGLDEQRIADVSAQVEAVRAFLAQYGE